MKKGLKVALAATLVFVLAIGGELFYLHRERNRPIALVHAPVRERISDDDLVFLKHKRQDSIADMRELVGTTVWVSAGGQLEYYPFAGHTANYGKAAGTLLGAEPLVVKDFVEQVAPKSATFRVPGGDKQVLMVFAKPNETKLYAVPMGYRQGGQYTFYADEILFYDDPHELYKHWGPEIWKAVDSHTVILGMNERQVELALGQVSKSTSQDYGNRTVVFANLGHPMAVTFERNKVTAFREDQGY
jgi:hypothetical protein